MVVSQQSQDNFTGDALSSNAPKNVNDDLIEAIDAIALVPCAIGPERNGRAVLQTILNSPHKNVGYVVAETFPFLLPSHDFL